MLTNQIFSTAPDLAKVDYGVRVENVVASGRLEQPLDLEQISGTIPGARYNPQRFPGLFFNMKKPKSLLVLFKSGKMISMGTRSVRQAKTAIINAVKELRSTGMVILGNPKIVIQNMVACADLKTRIDLEDMASSLRRTIYEPENFPGLIYIMDEPKVTLLLFTNGKVVCAGAKSEDDVHQAVARIHKTLELKGLTEHAANKPTIRSDVTAKEETISSGRQAPEELTCLATASST